MLTVWRYETESTQSIRPSSHSYEGCLPHNRSLFIICAKAPYFGRTKRSTDPGALICRDAVELARAAPLPNRCRPRPGPCGHPGPAAGTMFLLSTTIYNHNTLRLGGGEEIKSFGLILAASWWTKARKRFSSSGRVCAFGCANSRIQEVGKGWASVSEVGE